MIPAQGDENCQQQQILPSLCTVFERLCTPVAGLHVNENHSAFLTLVCSSTLQFVDYFFIGQVVPQSIHRIEEKTQVGPQRNSA